MKTLRIKLPRLRIPFCRRLQPLAVGFGHLFMSSGPFFSWLIILFFIFFTHIWLLPIVYLIWIWIFDREICENGGRRVECIRRSIVWKYFKHYFPINIKKDSEEIELDLKRNYLFCSFPHGLLATGVFIVFGSRAGGFHKMFPKHTPHILTLKQNFSVPLFRDFLLAMGLSAVSAESINFLMSKPKGGNAALLVVGGAEESFYCKPGLYQLVLKNRKGFARLALKNGSPLVPIFSFGETDIYDQVNNPKGSLLRMFQEKVKKITGVVPIIPVGRGFSQYTFGFIPHRKPINIIVGKPIDVEKIEDPTEEQVDALHAAFIKQLTGLFEKHKHMYLENPDKTNLVIV